MNKLLILLVGVFIAGALIPQDKLLLLKNVALTAIENNGEQVLSQSEARNQESFKNTDKQIKVSSSQVYKWVDKEGRTHFSTEAPTDDTQFTSKEYNPNTNIIESVKTKKAPQQQAYNPRQGLNIPIDNSFLNYDPKKLPTFREPIITDVDSMAIDYKGKILSLDEQFEKMERIRKKKLRDDKKRMEQGTGGRYYKY